MQCPNSQCNNRALHVLGEAAASVHFQADGTTIDTVEYGEWYLHDASEAYCDACDWAGCYRDCKEETDTHDV